MSRRRRVDLIASNALNPENASLNPDVDEENSDWGTVSDDNEEERSLEVQEENSSYAVRAIMQDSGGLNDQKDEESINKPKKSRNRKRNNKIANPASTSNHVDQRDSKHQAERGIVREELKKDDPSLVPKSGNYFLHDDRKRNNNHDDGRHRNNLKQQQQSNHYQGGAPPLQPAARSTEDFGRRQQRQNHHSYQHYNEERSGAPRFRNNDDDLDWKHDKFEELMREEQLLLQQPPRQPQKGDKRNNSNNSLAKKPVNYSNLRDHNKAFDDLYEDEQGPKLVYSTGMNPDEVDRKNYGRRRYQQQPKQQKQQEKKKKTAAVVSSKSILAPPPGLPLNPSAREFQPDFQQESNHQNFTRSNHNSNGIATTSQFSVADVASAWTSATAATSVVAPPLPLGYGYTAESLSYGYEPAVATTVMVNEYEYGNPMYVPNTVAAAAAAYGMMLPPPSMVMPLAPLGSDSSIWYPPTPTVVSASNGTVYYSTTTSTTSGPPPVFTTTASTRSKPVVRSPPNTTTTITTATTEGKFPATSSEI